MGRAEDLAQLIELHRRGQLTDVEFEAAIAQMAPPSEPRSAAPYPHQYAAPPPPATGAPTSNNSTLRVVLLTVGSVVIFVAIVSILAITFLGEDDDDVADRDSTIGASTSDWPDSYYDLQLSTCLATAGARLGNDGAETYCTCVMGELSRTLPYAEAVALDREILLQGLENAELPPAWTSAIRNCT